MSLVFSLNIDSSMQDNAESADRSSVSEFALDTTLLELVCNSDVSVRLGNCITTAFKNGNSPLITIGEYLAAGNNAIPKMLKLQNFGRRTAYELDDLVKQAGQNLIEDEPTQVCEVPSKFMWNGIEVDDSILDYSIVDLVKSRLVPQRLKNCIETNAHQSYFPFKTIRDYLNDNGSGIATLLKLQNFGRKSANDLRDLIEAYLTEKTGAVDPRTASICNNSSVNDVINYAVSLLKDNERQTLIFRYGLDGQKCHTLEEIGCIYNVTRARIGQIEDKALRKLRLPLYRDAVTESLISNKDYIFNLFECYDGIILDKDINRAKLNGEYLLAFDIAGWSIPSFLSKYRFQFAKGWARDEPLISELSRYKSVITECILGRRFPVSIDSIDTKFNEFSNLPISVALPDGLTHFDGLIFEGRVGRRKRRQARLFEMLRSGYQQLDKLTNDYNITYPEERCSCRDALIVMADASHLFMSLGDQGWASICHAQRYHTDIPKECDTSIEYQIESEDTSTEYSEANSLVELVRRLLIDKGPMHFVELREHVLSAPGHSYSRASLGPILIANDEFVRVSPGVYGLRLHYEQNDPVANYSGVLLNETDCQIYVMARWAGEKLNSFPFWTPSMEYEWCKWARSCCDRNIYSSLMYIANPYYWPVDDDVVDHWMEIKRRDENFSLLMEHKHSLADGLPSLRDIYAVTMVADRLSSMNWIRVNRVLGKRINDFHSATMMSMLIALEIIKPASHWQSHHSKGTRADFQLQRFAAEFTKNAEQTWSSKLGQELLHEMSTAMVDNALGWVDLDQFSILLDELSSKTGVVSSPESADSEEEILSPMDYLLNQMNRKNRENMFSELVDELLGE